MELLFHWLRYTLVFWGLIYIVTQSAIMLPLRLFALRISTLLGALIFCPACSGFWIGLVLGLLGIYGPPLSKWSHATIESALVATVLGYWWGTYFGDPHGFTKAIHALEQARRNVQEDV